MVDEIRDLAKPSQDAKSSTFSARWQWIAAMVVVLALLAAAWGFVLSIPLTGADVWPILAQGNRFLDDPSILWKQTYLEGLWAGAKFWRPATVAIAGIQWALFGESPWPYHAMRLAVFLVAVLLVAHASSLRAPRLQVAWLAGALLYMLHPVQTESVPAIARDADGWVNVLMITSIILLSRARESASAWPTIVGCAAALSAPFFKEPALLAPVISGIVLAPWERRSSRSRRIWLACLSLGLGLAIHIGFRYLLMGTVGHYLSVRYAVGRIDSARQLLRALFDHQDLAVAWPIAAILLGLAFVCLGLARTARIPSSPQWIRVRNGCLVWIFVSSAVFIASARFRPRYSEAILAPIVILIAGWLGSIIQLRRESSGRSRSLIGLALVLVTLSLPIGMLTGTPLIWDYGQWKLAGTTSDRILASITSATRASHDSGRPMRVDSGRFQTIAFPSLEESGKTDFRLTPYPYKTRQPPGWRSGRISTVVIMGPQSLNGYLELTGLIEIIGTVYPGTPALDIGPEDIGPVLPPREISALPDANEEREPNSS